MTATDTLSTIMSLQAAGNEAALTDGETAELQARLWMLLRHQAALKTQGDSASLLEEEAAELLDSVVYTLKLHLDVNALPIRTLLTQNMPSLFTAAQETVLACYRETESLYHTALRSVVTLGSRSLADMLTGIGGFFRAYDYRLYAHQLPADIDYPLCLPVPDTLHGVLWLREYLKRLLVENELLRRFSVTRITALLTYARPEYGDLIVNLYEPVAACVTGLALLGGGETLLEITVPQAANIAAQLHALSRQEAQTLLRTAAGDACRRLGLTDASQIYLMQTAETLYPRITAAEGSACGVFSVRETPVP